MFRVSPRCRLAAALASSLMATVLSGCQQVESTAEAQPASNSTPVVQVVAPTQTTLVHTTTQPATVHAWHEAEVHARVAGYLEELKVDIGQQVSQGQVLARLAVPEMEIAHQKQEATIRRLLADEQRATASVKLAAAEVQSAEAEAAQAAAEVGSATAQLTAAKSEFVRVTDLVNAKSVAGRLLDEARQKYESAAALQASAEAALQSSKAAVAVTRERAAVAQADFAAAQAETEVARKSLEELATMLSYASLKAPFDGVVTRRSIDPGDLIRKADTSSAESARPLFSIAQVQKVRVRIALPENDAALANVGDSVALQVRARSGRTFNGTISRTARTLDEATRTMLVEVDLPNEDGALLPGMFGHATITLQKTPNALTLSATAVRFDEKGNSSVYVVDGSGAVNVIPVVTGYDDGRQIEIVSGIDVAARVVDGGVGRLQSGQKVRVQ